MPLDPILQAFVNQSAGNPQPPMSEQPIEQARAGYDMIAAAGGALPELAGADDRAIPGPAGDIPIRVYRPIGDGPFPVVVFFHGGGFTIGSLTSHDPLARQLAAQAEAVVVAVDYRLAPEHKFPAAVDD